jgi:hypothetical protein
MICGERSEQDTGAVLTLGLSVAEGGRALLPPLLPPLTHVHELGLEGGAADEETVDVGLAGQVGRRAARH